MLTGTGGTERLSERNAVTAIVRVALDEHGAVVHGEVLDTVSGTVQRFAGWEGLVEAIRRWLGRAGTVGHD
jgi:hypothetical protein